RVLFRSGLPKTGTSLKVAAARRVAVTSFRRWRERLAKVLWPRRFPGCRDLRACGIRARLCGRREAGELARPATPPAGVRCPPRWRSVSAGRRRAEPGRCDETEAAVRPRR